MGPVLLSSGTGSARSWVRCGPPWGWARTASFGEPDSAPRTAVLSAFPPPHTHPSKVSRPSSFSLRPPPPPAVWRWAVTAPPPVWIPPSASPARPRACATEQRGSGPRSPGFRTRAGRAGCEGSQRHTDLDVGKPGFRNGFAVWPWASHSPSLGPTSSTIRKQNWVPSCRAS